MSDEYYAGVGLSFSRTGGDDLGYERSEGDGDLLFEAVRELSWIF